MMNEPMYADWKHVDPSKEAADLYIMNHSRKGEIVITQDIGLASTLLLKGVHVLTPKGTLFEEKDIYNALDFRYLKQRQENKEFMEKIQNH
jgi:uncharacterized protein